MQYSILKLVLKFDRLPSNLDLLPDIGNGFISTVAMSNSIYLIDTFNGKGKESHRYLKMLHNTCIYCT